MHDHTAPSSQKEPGSFLTGFTVGLVAGAVGYFLFTTDRGEDVRKSLQREWKEAQKDFVKQSATEAASEAVHEATVSIRELAQKAVKRFSEQIEEAGNKGKAASKKSKPGAKAKKSSKNTFNGV